MGIVVIIRDYVEEVLATPIAPRQHIIDLAITKATTTLRAVIFTRKLRFQKVKLEGNALQLVQALLKEDNNWYMYDQLIDDARVILNYLQS